MFGSRLSARSCSTLCGGHTRRIFRPWAFVPECRFPPPPPPDDDAAAMSCLSCSDSIPVTERKWMTSTYVLYTDLTLEILGLTRTGCALRTPVTSTLSPGWTASTRSSKQNVETEAGVWPAGTLSGVSWIRTSCLSAYTPRLCWIWYECFVEHCGQRVGSVTFPRSTETTSAWPQMTQAKCANLRSGMTGEHRTTIPLMLTSDSMSTGSRHRKLDTVLRLYGRT